MADFPKNLDFQHYMALGTISYGAKYSHRVREQFAHTFETSYFCLKMCVFIDSLSNPSEVPFQIFHFPPLVRHPVLASTRKDAHRKVSITAAIFAQSYGTRAKLWPKPFQNLAF